MTDASFKWDSKIAEKIGEKLSVDVAKIQERIRVYRAMKQLHNDTGVARAELREALGSGLAKLRTQLS